MGRQRTIGLAHAPNCRDLGGYPAADGKTVKWGSLYRADALSELDDGELAILSGLKIRTVIDFRDRGEILYSPDRLPETAVNQTHIPIEAGRLMNKYNDGYLTPKKTTGIMISVYRALAHDCQPSFREFFRIVSDPDKAPVLFHCTAGKDRTGFAAAMLLSALGVDRDRVAADYLLSAECLKSKYIAGVDYDDTLRPLYTVEPEFLSAAFEVIDNQFGGVETFLRTNLEVDVELLRKLYTE